MTAGIYNILVGQGSAQEKQSLKFISQEMNFITRTSLPRPSLLSVFVNYANVETESLGDLVMCGDVMKCKEVEGRQGSGS